MAAFFLFLFTAGTLSSSEIKEIFQLFDKNNSNYVSIAELGTLVRALNLNPTEDEIDAMKQKVESLTKKGFFDLKTLEEVVQARGKDKETIQDLIDALNVFDTDKDGKISVAEFRTAMQQMGEKMEEKDINEIIQDSELVDNNQYIVIETFARMIMNRI